MLVGLRLHMEEFSVPRTLPTSSIDPPRSTRDLWFREDEPGPPKYGGALQANGYRSVVQYGTEMEESHRTFCLMAAGNRDDRQTTEDTSGSMYICHGSSGRGCARHGVGRASGGGARMAAGGIRRWAGASAPKGSTPAHTGVSMLRSHLS